MKAITLVALVFLIFCQFCSPKAPSEAEKPVSGHLRMVAILDSIQRHADPMECLNMNASKAAFFHQVMQSSTGNQAMMAQFNYADQLLKSGKNEEAIMQWQQMIQMTGDQLTEQTKILYELLALAYLRMGEQDNCINAHTSESCILPIQGNGLWKLKTGGETAIAMYLRILQQFPDDVQTQWLLNLACMTTGQWPAAVPEKFRMPASIYAKRGNIRFSDSAIPLGIDVRGISGSVCMEDFDLDGNLDLFVTSYGIGDQARYFKNNGDGSFSDRTTEANLKGILSGLNVIHADYDNDGDPDIFILRGAWLAGGTHPNSLLRNNGDGTFTDVTIEAGLLSFHPTQTAAWADYDGDGWLDLFIANETFSANRIHPCELFHNNGNGTFTDVSSSMGMDIVGTFKATVWGDFNNDQRPDLYISNLGGPNLLWMNRGGTDPAAWQFENVSEQAGVIFPENSFPAFVFDYDNDGLDDIFVTNFDLDPNSPSAAPIIQEFLGHQPEGDWLRLYQNNGNATFTDVHRKLGLHTITYAMGNNFGDLDNDGWPDIYLGTGKPDLRALIPNRVFHNLEGKRFEDISMNGFSHIQKGHGLAFGDIDNDGDQDIYVVVGGAFEGDVGHNILYENSGSGNHWLTLFLEGVTCNRDAIGGRIKVQVKRPDGQIRAIYSTVGTGGSFGSNSLRQEIGLGDAVSIISVEVQWPKPGLATSVYSGLDMDRAYTLKEGEQEARPRPLDLIKLRQDAL